MCFYPQILPAIYILLYIPKTIFGYTFGVAKKHVADEEAHNRFVGSLKLFKYKNLGNKISGLLDLVQKKIKMEKRMWKMQHK